MTEERQWVFCPCCGAKTRLQLARQTELRLFPPVLPEMQEGNHDQRPAVPGVRRRNQRNMM